MFALLWFAIGLSAGARLGFIVFGALHMSRKADDAAMPFDEAIDDAELLAASELRRIRASSLRIS